MARAVLALVFVTHFSFAQVRVGKLVISAGQTYEIAPSDILVADTLIMMDSSRIVLNSLKRENYIRVGVGSFGKNSLIDGRGVAGKPGRNGGASNSPFGPCRDGENGKNGGRGLDGTPGTDLYLYVDQLTGVGGLVIDLSGGNGGNGGDGGIGADGSPGTRHCDGGDGGKGGDGGAGGNGGVGGTLILGGEELDSLRTLLRDKITVYNKGGSFGYGGVAGYGGPPGLGPSGRNGSAGLPGADGVDGQAADNGTIVFEER